MIYCLIYIYIYMINHLHSAYCEKSIKEWLIWHNLIRAFKELLRKQVRPHFCATGLLLLIAILTTRICFGQRITEYSNDRFSSGFKVYHSFSCVNSY